MQRSFWHQTRSGRDPVDPPSAIDLLGGHFEPEFLLERACQHAAHGVRLPAGTMQGRYGDAAEVPGPEDLGDQPGASTASRPSAPVAAVPEVSTDEEGAGLLERLRSAVTGTLDATKETVGGAVSATGQTASRVTRAMAKPFANRHRLSAQADPAAIDSGGGGLRRDDGEAAIAQLRRELAELREQNRHLATRSGT